MEPVKCRGKMVQNTREPGHMDKLRFMVDSNGQTGRLTVDPGPIICHTDKAPLSSKTGVLIEAKLSQDCNKELAKSVKKMDQTTLDNIIKVKRKVKESMFGKMVPHTTDSGSTINPTVWEFITGKMDVVSRASGVMVNATG